MNSSICQSAVFCVSTVVYVIRLTTSSPSAHLSTAGTLLSHYTSMFWWQRLLNDPYWDVCCLFHESLPPTQTPSYPLNSGVSSCWPWGDTLSIWDIQEINHLNVSRSPLKTPASWSLTGLFPVLISDQETSSYLTRLKLFLGISSLQLGWQSKPMDGEGGTSFFQDTSMGGGAVSIAALLTALVNRLPWPQEVTNSRWRWGHQTCPTVDMKGPSKHADGACFSSTGNSIR